MTAGGGAAIDIEIWAMPMEEFGRFVDAVPPPLSIGTLVMADGRKVKGFLVEAEATVGRPRHFRLRRLARVHAAGAGDRAGVIRVARTRRWTSVPIPHPRDSGTAA